MKLLLILLLAVHSHCSPLDVNASIESAENTQESPASPIDEVEPAAPITESSGSEEEGKVNEGEAVESTPSEIDDPAFSVVEELMEEAEDLHDPEHSSPSESSPVDDVDKEAHKDDADLPTESDEEESAKELVAEAEKETEQQDPELLHELQELQSPVESVPTATGATATTEGVTVRFQLKETWAVAGGRNRGYTVIIENRSDKDVCGVTFMPNAKTINMFHLSMGYDGSLTTKSLTLATEEVDRKFGYISSDRSLPTIIAVTYC